MKTFSKISAQIAFLILVATACSDKDEPTFDQRDMVIGHYFYTSTVYDQAGNQTAITGYLSVDKRDPNLLRINLDGQDLIGSKVTGDATGMLFDVEPVTFSDQEGDAYQLRGLGRYQHEGLTYHAYYNDATGVLSMTLATDYIDNTFDDYNTVVEFRATPRQ